MGDISELWRTFPTVHCLLQLTHDHPPLQLASSCLLRLFLFSPLLYFSHLCSQRLILNASLFLVWQRVDFESGSNPTSCRKYTSEDFRQFLRTTHPENKSDFAKQDKQQIWSVNKLCFAEEDISSEIESCLLVEQARR